MARLISGARHIVREALDDNLTGEAAKLAYYAFLSIFPAVLVLFALTGLLGGERAFDWIMGRLGTTLPSEAASYLGRYVRDVTAQARPDILSAGLLLLLWSSSNVFAALADGLNTMYDLGEERSWWKKRLVAVAFLLGSVVFLVAAVAVILAGGPIGEALGLDAIWDVLGIVVAFLLLATILWAAYTVLPNRKEKAARLPTFVGAVVGALLWAVATLGFRFYVSNFGSYSVTYGAVGAAIVLMLWLYLSGVAILFGGEVASVLERRRKGRGDTTRGEALRRAA